MGLGMSMAVGAGAGAGGSYMTGGNIGQGAVMGAMGGAALGMGGGMAMRAGARGATSAGASKGFTSGMVDAASGLDNAANRAYTFAAGGLLGGMAFGGNKSHSRGFNSQRGNRIGR